jgi:hypothetical protein
LEERKKGERISEQKKKKKEFNLLGAFRKQSPFVALVALRPHVFRSCVLHCCVYFLAVKVVVPIALKFSSKPLFQFSVHGTVFEILLAVDGKQKVCVHNPNNSISNIAIVQLKYKKKEKKKN